MIQREVLEKVMSSSLSFLGIKMIPFSIQCPQFFGQPGQPGLAHNLYNLSMSKVIHTLHSSDTSHTHLHTQ